MHCGEAVDHAAATGWVPFKGLAAACGADLAWGDARTLAACTALQEHFLALKALPEHRLQTAWLGQYRSAATHRGAPRMDGAPRAVSKACSALATWLWAV